MVRMRKFLLVHLPKNPASFQPLLPTRTPHDEHAPRS